jgi:hypothetical protein
MALILDGTDGITSSGGTNVLQDASVEMSNLNATGTPSDTTFLRGDGAWETAGSPPGTLELLQEDVFTTSGTWTKASGFDPDDTVMVFLVGGGGGGAAATTGSVFPNVAATGGQAGCCVILSAKYADVPSSTYTLTVGGGGSGAVTTGTDTRNDGSDGNNTFLTNTTNFASFAALGGCGGSQTGTGAVATRIKYPNKRASSVIYSNTFFATAGAVRVEIDAWAIALSDLPNYVGANPIGFHCAPSARSDEELSVATYTAERGYHINQVFGSGGSAARQTTTNRTSYNPKVPALFNTGGNGSGTANGQNGTGIGGGGGACTRASPTVAQAGNGHAGGMIVRYYRGRVSPWQVINAVGA